MPKIKRALTKEFCESRPATRLKAYDRKCPGFYASVTPRGVASFHFRYWNKARNKQVSVLIGTYHPELFTIEDARTKAKELSGRVARGEKVAEKARRAKTERANLIGLTVNKLIDLYIAHVSTEVMKPWGKIAPRVESWKSYRGFLNRFTRPTLGPMLASEVKKVDVARMVEDVRAGEVNPKYKGTKSNARNAQEITSALFNWGVEYSHVAANPCVDLPELEPRNRRKRVLKAAEIRHLWWGLDHPDLPWPRSVALAFKFRLATMLRAKEFVSGRPDELEAVGINEVRFNIPAERVKLRRPIVQPLSSLAQEILAEAIRSPDQKYLFPDDDGEAMPDRILTIAASGLKPRVYPNGDEQGGVPGICEFLGMQKWTPRDLRRTAASLAYEMGCDKREIGYCLDHAGDGAEEEQAERVTDTYVTEGIFERSRRYKTKLDILEKLALGLRRIIGAEPPALLPAPTPALPKAA